MAGKILFIVVDQMRADCVNGALAGSLDLPNISRLRDEGVTFARHYTVTAPCGPARASLLTGLYAMNHRSVRNGTPLRHDIPNIATEARKANYEPLLFGYTDTSIDPTGRDPNDPDLKSYEGLMPGFAEVVQLRLDTSYSWVADLKAKGYDLPGDYWDIYRARVSGDDPLAAITGPALYSAEDSDTAFLTDQTLRALSVREAQDWFAHITYIRPHPPFVAPAPYNAMYPPDAVPEPAGFGTLDSLRQSHPFFSAFFSEPSQKGLYIGFDGRMDRLGGDEAKALRAVYFALASEVDAHIGRLLDYLDASGQADDTLVIFTSDHGEMLGDHHMWGKDSVFDPAFHVPLVIRDPRRREAAGTLVEAFTECIDVAPTILGWLGQKPPLGFNGRSLLPFLEGGTPENWRGHVFFELDLGDPIAPTRFQRHMQLDAAACNLAVLREDRFKLVHFNGSLPPLLYDMEAGEGTNLAGDPVFQPELLRLSRKMLDHRMTHADHAYSLMKLTSQGVATPD
jgi:arylsulfatase A-like enzyme